MTPRAQVGRNPYKSNLSRRLRKRMVDLELTFTGLAKLVKHPRESVSRAVHHGAHPRVLVAVRKALDV